MTTIAPPRPIVTVQMLRAWGGAKVGESASFDEARAFWLIKHGYASSEPPSAPRSKAKPKSSPKG